MADDTTTESTDQPTPDEAPEAKPEIDWKAKAREWETRAKANKTAADELAALKQAQMTEQERLTAQLSRSHQGGRNGAHGGSEAAYRGQARGIRRGRRAVPHRHRRGDLDSAGAAPRQP